jgi:hypothetical protein
MLTPRPEGSPTEVLGDLKKWTVGGGGGPVK